MKRPSAERITKIAEYRAEMYVNHPFSPNLYSIIADAINEALDEAEEAPSVEGEKSHG